MPTTLINLNSTTPPAPGGGSNVIFQNDSSNPINVSAYVDIAAAGAITGTIAINQVAFGSGVNAIQGTANLTWLDDPVDAFIIKVNNSDGFDNLTIAQTDETLNRPLTFSFSANYNSSGYGVTWMISNLIAPKPTASGELQFWVRQAGNPVQTLTLLSTGGIAIIGPSTISGNTLLDKNIAATSVLNQSSPVFTLTGEYWTGAASAQDEYTIQNVVSAGANPITSLVFSHSGSSGGGSVSFPGGVLAGGDYTAGGSYIAAGGFSVGGNGLFYGNTPATALANITFGYLELAGNYWTGAASAQDYWRLAQTLGTGSNPTTTLALTHSGTPGVATILLPSGVGVVQPLANAPSTSSSTGTAGQIAWDTQYVYICTATNTWVRNTVPFSTF